MSKARANAETLRTALVAGDVTNANFTGADLEVGKGGTGASSAGAARTALGVVIGTNVLAPDGNGSALTGIDSLPSQSSQSGKFLTTNGSAASWGEVGGGLTLATPVATTSGTSITFTGLPSGVKRITILLNGVSTNGTGEKLITIGDSGGLETSGYVSAGGRIVSTSPEVGYAGTGFILYSTRASGVINGGIVLALENAATNTWIAYGTAGASTNASFIISGKKSLSAELTQLSFSMTPDSFDAGEINISYE